MMNKKEVAELKKRVAKDKNNILRVCGCYVSGQKEKLATFNENFLTMDEEETFKYLEIAKKCYSGKLGNNLIYLEFPTESEQLGGTQHSLLALRDSKLKDDNLLDAFYDKIIETYECASNYLIVLFYDVYDVITKAKDKGSLDESEITYESVLCAICPVELTKPALGYSPDDNRMVVLARDWFVKPPETGFLFPAFDDRMPNIHATLMYSKNTTEPHTEIMDMILGCPVVETEDITRSNIEDIVSKALSLGGKNEDEVEESLLLFHQGLHDKLEEYQATYPDANDYDILALSEDILEEVLQNMDLDEEVVDNITIDFKKEYRDKELYVSKVCNESLLSKKALELENISLKERIKVLTKQLNKQSNADA